MKFDKCESDNIADVSAKCNDQFCLSYKGHDKDGYVPSGIGLGDKHNSDYVSFRYCFNCGKIQGDFPIKESAAITFTGDEYLGN